MSKSNLNALRKELKRLSAQLHHLLADSSAESSARIQSLLQRIRKLIQMLRGYIGRRELSRILGAAALFFGLGSGPELQAQSFGPAQDDPYGLFVSSSVEYPCLVDIDGDGDLDMMAGGNAYDNNGYYTLEAKMYFFENTGSATAPQFSAPVLNPFGLNIDTLQLSGFRPDFADIDGDGDLDLFIGTGSQLGGACAFFENTGTAQAPGFAQPVVNPFGFSDYLSYSFAQLVDLDGDGDLDILYSSVYGELNYSENIGTATNPNFAAPVSEPFGIQAPAGGDVRTYIAAGDIDKDGDYDLVTQAYYGLTLIFYENTGTPTNPQFAPPNANTSFMPTFGYDYIYVELADLDGDGDVDLMAASYDNFFAIVGNEKYVYHENTTPGNVNLEQLPADLIIYPNLVTDYIHLEVNDAEIAEVLIFDQAGKMLLSIGQQAETIDVSQLAMGSYVLQVILDDGRLVSSEFVKN